MVHTWHSVFEAPPFVGQAVNLVRNICVHGKNGLPPDGFKGGHCLVTVDCLLPRH